jgi:predicted DNA-binding transcriptional regulator YafY
MDRYERIHRIHRQLKASRYPVAFETLREDLGCSRATLYRDLAFLRDALGAPLLNDSEAHAVSYARGEADRFELPGLWLSSDELSALLVLNQLLARTGPGVLSQALAPLRERIERLLTDDGVKRRSELHRIRVTGSGARRVDEKVFRQVAAATLDRRRLRIRYRARSTGQDSVRRLSPQRLTHYRENWFLDAFDHEREALRSFAVDRIVDPVVIDEATQDMGQEQLDSHLAASYGIFSGAPKAWAVLRFSPRAARWVADEHWHTRQEGRFLDDGRYELKVPYSSSKELLMDVLRYGPEAEVLAPPALREEARILLELALSSYRAVNP